MLDSESTKGCPVPMPLNREGPLNLPPELGLFRDTTPIRRLAYPDGHVGWLVTSYELARAVLAHPSFSVGLTRRAAGDPVAFAASVDVRDDIASGLLLNVDPPQHTRIRRTHNAAFTVRRVSEHRAMIESIVTECLTSMAHARSPCDFVQSFALPVSSLTLCGLLGVPASDRERFETPNAIMGDSTATPDTKVAAVKEFSEYAREVIHRKRHHPVGDLLSNLASDGELTDDELTGIAFSLFRAGHDTTASMFAMSMFALLSQRERWEALRGGDPSFIKNAVEELLRYVTILHTSVANRTAMEDVHVGGETIKEGESVAISLAAANRDPQKFEAAETLDFDRDPRGHLAFGHGVHMCIGQHLARLELTTGLAGLINRFPTLDLAVSPEEVPWRCGDVLVSVDRLPVVW